MILEPVATAAVSSDNCASVSHTPNASDLSESSRQSEDFANVKTLASYGRLCKCQKQGKITWRSTGRCSCFSGGSFNKNGGSFKLPTIDEAGYDGDASTVCGSYRSGSCFSVGSGGLPPVFHDVESWLQAEQALASTRAGIAQIPEDVLEDLPPAEKVKALLGNPVREVRDDTDSIQAVNFVKSSSFSNGLEDWRHRGLEVNSSKSSGNVKGARPRREINGKNAR